MLRKIGLFCICCLLAATWQTSATARPLIIAANPQAPFKYEADGQVRGIDIEVMDEVLRELAIDYEVLLIESDQRLQVEAKAGRIDMLLLYSQNEDRRTFLDYPNESYIDLDWNFFIRAEDRGKFTFSKFDDLRSITIGATHGISYTPEFWDAGLQLQLVSENSLQIDKLLAGRIDAVPMNTISTLHQAHIGGYRNQIDFLPKPMKSKAYYNVFSKASTHPDMDKLKTEYDRIIRRMKDDGLIDQIKATYIGPSS